jgi:hypothetical protein
MIAFVVQHFHDGKDGLVGEAGNRDGFGSNGDYSG